MTIFQILAILFFCWVVPVLRFKSPFSFSVVLFDFTFATEDGGLAMCLGWTIHFTIFLPFYLSDPEGRKILKNTLKSFFPKRK
tara:strand:+ start:157 stop:405 length:249 start_codon:yes stop_codon:yes gene_type:complete